eukprot:COSAG05_NODE_101_length_19100_cov_24.260144_16_plen_63_part_00
MVHDAQMHARPRAGGGGAEAGASHGVCLHAGSPLLWYSTAWGAYAPYIYIAQTYGTKDFFYH